MITRAFTDKVTVPKIQKPVYKLFEISVVVFFVFLISYYVHLSQHGKETISKICHLFIILLS